MREIQLVKHDTPESIVTRHFNFEEDPAFTLADIGSLGGEDEAGNEVEFSTEQMLEGIRETKFWGFSIKPKMEVHVWASADAPRERLMMLLGHEIGHLRGEQLDGTVEEEERADTYGEVAALAFTMMGQVTG
jgi:hypothetical protein